MPQLSTPYNDTIHELLVKYLLGEASAEDAATVQAWIAAAPENRQQYLQLQMAWEESRRLATAHTPDTEAAWVRMKRKLQTKPQPAKVVPYRTNFYWMRIAAIFILTAGGLWWFSTLFKTPVHTLAIQTGTKPETDTLPDGSVVILNKHSQISYPSRFSDTVRAIALKGEAFFNITPNKKAPFIITVNNITVRVLGTSFNIRSSGGITEVIVETGLVQVTKKNTSMLLRPKEKIVVGANDSVLQKGPVKDQLHNYYRTKTFVCDNTPLWKLVQVLNEAYGSNIVIGRQSLRNLPLNTTFNNEPLDNILAVIGETFSIDVVKQDDKIILQ